MKKKLITKSKKLVPEKVEVLSSPVSSETKVARVMPLVIEVVGKLLSMKGAYMDRKRFEEKVRVIMEDD